MVGGGARVLLIAGRVLFFIQANAGDGGKVFSIVGRAFVNGSGGGSTQFETFIGGYLACGSIMNVLP
jgi:hypothetical protein